MLSLLLHGERPGQLTASVRPLFTVAKVWLLIARTHNGDCKKKKKKSVSRIKQGEDSKMYM